jgi:osmotically inducible lipoprotein OsmB
MTSPRLAVLFAALLGLSACSGMSHTQQRMLSGGAIGAAGGLALTALTGGSLLAGGLVGGAGGAAVGALIK